MLPLTTQAEHNRQHQTSLESRLQCQRTHRDMLNQQRQIDQPDSDGVAAIPPATVRLHGVKHRHDAAGDRDLCRQLMQSGQQKCCSSIIRSMLRRPVHSCISRQIVNPAATSDNSRNNVCSHCAEAGALQTMPGSTSAWPKTEAALKRKLCNSCCVFSRTSSIEES